MRLRFCVLSVLGDVLDDGEHAMTGESDSIRKRCGALRFQLVATELDLAITFCEVAANANDPTKYDHNIIAHAMKAYSTAVHFLLSDPKTAVELEINKKLTRIGFLLGDFGDFGRMRSPAVM